MTKRTAVLALAAALCCLCNDPVRAAGDGESGSGGGSHGVDGVLPHGPFDLVTLRVTSIVQRSRPFRSAYDGENSLPAEGERRGSTSVVLGLGKTLAPGLQAYLDLRSLHGGGLGNENGLASYANGDFSQGARTSGPYVLRAFLRGWHALGSSTDRAERDVDQIPGSEPAERLEWKIGRFLPGDDFDDLRYAHTPLTQFINLGLVNNPAWDNAQNARGTTDGVMLALIREHFELRAGSYRMPTTANGPHLDRDLAHARSDNLELTLKAGDQGPLWRLLLFRNIGRMGDYRSVLAAAAGTGQPPRSFDDERPGRRKRGITTNVEVPLADDGETGVFACAGWNDGRTEDFSFTEVDRNVCAGAQVSGAHWSREGDRLGLAVLAGGLSTPHRQYLEAGGTGFQLGDGALRYGRERLVELYYRLQLARWLQLTPDLQWIRNPGFNADRGPVRIFSLRVHVML